MMRRCVDSLNAAHPGITISELQNPNVESRSEREKQIAPTTGLRLARPPQLRSAFHRNALQIILSLMARCGRSTYRYENQCGRANATMGCPSLLYLRHCFSRLSQNRPTNCIEQW